MECLPHSKHSIKCTEQLASSNSRGDETDHHNDYTSTGYKNRRSILKQWRDKCDKNRSDAIEKANQEKDIICRN